MPYVADLHVHSRFAGACSPQLSVPNLAKWAKYKGIDVLGTGDCLHPAYFQELKTTLEESGDGIYEYGGVKFFITSEIALAYTDKGKGRRIHHIIILPSLEAATKLTEEFGKRGINYGYEGRPMIGLSSRALCELLFKIDPEIILIPAHIWTPWYGLYGSNSGYDSLKDCFEEFTDEILAVETGISSEPAMNWRVPELDSKSIVSFSDLHSLPRLGREVTLFKGRPTFQELRFDLKNQNIVGTIEFFPEEGKYHYSGHRKCDVVYSPEEIEKRRDPSNPSGQVCPVCKRRLTIGVMQRVEELAKREKQELRIKNQGGIHTNGVFPNRPGFRMLVQLEEILAEAFSTIVKNQKVQDEYLRLVTTLDSELKILTKTPIELIEMTAGERVAEGVKRVREGNLVIEPGFDNTYGKVRIWNDEENNLPTLSEF